MMNDTVWTALNGLEEGKTQVKGEMTVTPLFDPTHRTLEYITLNEALAASTLRITEISMSGSVPELEADNRGDKAVLLFDGEEVAGAKQNRVFNTSILVEARTKIRIPVSCTERGRWGYREPDFRPSGNVMAAKLRARKAAYVSASLEAGHSYRGDQGSVWRDVEKLHESFESSSPTDAMSDAYKRRKADIDKLSRRFRPENNQIGFIVALEGRLLGLDYVSNPSAFAHVYPKLIRSYALEGLDSRRQFSKGADPEKIDPEADLLEYVRNLLLDTESSTESLHKSVGMGRDYRYTSPSLVGTALVAEGEVVHLGLLRKDQS